MVRFRTLLTLFIFIIFSFVKRPEPMDMALQKCFYYLFIYYNFGFGLQFYGVAFFVSVAF